MKRTFFRLGVASTVLAFGTLAAAQSANFAGTWLEDQSKQQVRDSTPLRFQVSTDGQLQELRGPVEKPVTQLVKFGVKPYGLEGTGSTNLIEWTKTDDDHFIRRIYDKNGKLLATRRIEISADGSTMTEVTELAANGEVRTFTLKRTSGTKGLRGTWTKLTFKSNKPETLRIEALSNGVKMTDSTGTIDTINFDGKPALVSGPTVIAGTTLSGKLINARTIDVIRGRDGVKTGTESMVLSSDGKTLTISAKANLSEEPSVGVYTKQ